MKKKPQISIVIPSYNEEESIGACLDSIFKQDYPEKNLEVIVVDDNSTDKTVEIAKKYPVKIVKHNNKHGEIGKMIGFKKAKGELAMYLDADIELRGKNWFRKMVKPLLEDESIIGSFTRYYSKKDTSPIERYLNFDPLQRDSIYQYFSPSIEESVKKKESGYLVCEYQEKKIPPAGLCLYRREKLMQVVGDYDMFLELDFLVLMVRDRNINFAYVPDAGLYHHHVSSLTELIKKRLYNLNNVYLAREKRYYKWFDMNSLSDLIKIAAWVIYANFFVPSFFVGIYKSIKHKDWAGMYEPFVNLLVTDFLIASFIFSNKHGELFENT